jgi:hypothetical protein
MALKNYTMQAKNIYPATTLFLPDSFAIYNALSASSNNWVCELRSSGIVLAIPMLIITYMEEDK